MIVVLVGLGTVAGWLWVLERANRGRPPHELGLRTARQIVEQREALEAQDLDELLDASNARRRARGLPERGADDVIRVYASGSGGDA